MRPPSYVLACKLKTLKGDLKHWNKHVFGMYRLGKIDRKIKGLNTSTQFFLLQKTLHTFFALKS